VNRQLRVVGARNAQVVDNRTVQKRNVPLTGAIPGTPSIGPGSLFGYLPLAGFGVPPDPIGDEVIINYDVPAFVYAGKPYTAVGVTSNGYLVAGGGTAEDIDCCNNVVIPDPARPNNTLAPFWTDLDGSNDEGIRAAILEDAGTGQAWLVLEWQVKVFGTDSNRHFQVWLGLNGTEDITYAYDPAALPASSALATVVGAENINGSGGDTITLPVTGDLRVTSSAPTPGASVTYRVGLRGVDRGTGVVTTTMDSPDIPGTTVVQSEVVVGP
jgi:hypothetical protein